MEAPGQREEGYRRWVETLPGVAWLARPDGFIESFNPSAREYFGLPAEAVPAWDWLKAVHPDDGEQVRETWGRASQNGNPSRHRSA